MTQTRQRNTQPCIIQLPLALHRNLNIHGTWCTVVAASRGMLRTAPEDGASAPSSAPCMPRLAGLLSTTSSRRRAALSGIVAAPILLWRTPPGHPVGETSITIVGRTGGADRGTTHPLTWAALPMHPAAPFLLADGPSHHPIGKAVCTIVRVGRAGWHDWRWRHKWHRHWHRHRRRSCWRATPMVMCAAPRLLVCLPHVWGVNCAIEGIDRTDWPSRQCRKRPWLRRRGRGRWRRRRCWRRSGLRGDGSPAGSSASHPCCGAAVLLLSQRPRCLPVHGACSAVISRRAREQPQQQGQQQEQAQKAAGRDEASEIPPGANCIKVATTSDVLVCRLLDV